MQTIPERTVVFILDGDEDRVLHLHDGDPLILPARGDGSDSFLLRCGLEVLWVVAAKHYRPETPRVSWGNVEHYAGFSHRNGGACEACFVGLALA